MPPLEKATGLPDIVPTNTCFDDAVEFFLHADVMPDEMYRFCVVHGICRGHAQGTLFAHAWVEQNGSAVWQAGIARATGERFYYALPLPAFYEMYAVQKQQTSRYALPAMWEMIKLHDHSGPWRREYRELCEKVGERVVGMMRGVSPVAYLRCKNGVRLFDG